MKKLLSLVLSFALLFALAVPASAAVKDEYQLEYDHIDTVAANLTIDRTWGLANCTGFVEASGDYPVCVDVYLQQKNGNVWTTLQSWTSDGRGATGVGGKYAVPQGYQYRTLTVGYVYNSSGTIIDSATASYGVTY